MNLKKYSDENVAVFVRGNKNVELMPWKITELDKNDVLISITSVGICGSDLKYWAYGKCGRFKLDNKPMVIGHEAAGRIEVVGTDVKHLKVGDRVAIEPGVSCKRCEICLGGRYNLCPKMRFCATPPVHGNLCRFYRHDSSFCYKLPDDVTDEEGAMVEPLSVAVHTCRRALVRDGNRVLIFGSGPIGILCGLVAKQLGAVFVVITDIDQNRLNDAAKFEAGDAFYRVTTDDDVTTLSEKLKKMFIEGLPHSAFECSGADSSLQVAMKVVGPGSSVMLVGRGSPKVELPVVDAGTFEVDIKGIFRYANTYPTAIEMISKKKINVKQLITHRFNISDSQDAFLTASDPKSQSIKVMINCDVTN